MQNNIAKLKTLSHVAYFGWEKETRLNQSEWKKLINGYKTIYRGKK